MPEKVSECKTEAAAMAVDMLINSIKHSDQMLQASKPLKPITFEKSRLKTLAGFFEVI